MAAVRAVETAKNKSAHTYRVKRLVTSENAENPFPDSGIPFPTQLGRRP
jgi:hypothetical protein